MERVYRFRSIDRLLGSSQELEKQAIYFARPSQLNDPAEGIFPFVWQGDKIVWMNFFRHYLHCLHCKCLDFAILVDHTRIAEIPPPVINGRSLASTTVMSQIHGNVVQKVFNNTTVEELVKVLVRSEYPIGNSGILFLCQIFHHEAIEVIRAVHQEFGYPLPYFPDKPSPFNPTTKISEILEIMISGDYSSALFQQATQLLFGSQSVRLKYLLEQQKMDHAQATDIGKENYGFLCYDFPQTYLEHLYILTYPNWYAACFSKNCSNAASWASYGDNHRGVCLIFGEEHDSKEAGLTLNTVFHNVGNSTHLSSCYHKFYDVSYGTNDKKIDFFRSLGRVPRGILIKTWYSDDGGKFSKCAAPIQGDVDSWRKEYWNQFFPVIVQKSSDWQHEGETRLIRHGGLDDLSEEERLSTYDFSSLVGVIFGVRTRDSKKIEIIDVIRQKCLKHSRQTFEFHQAYLTETCQIEKYEIRSLGRFV